MTIPTLQHSFGPNAFVDSTIPSGYAPFNVQAIPGNKIVVTYAKQDAAKHDRRAGTEQRLRGCVRYPGHLQFRLAREPYMNAPWGAVVPLRASRVSPAIY